MPSRLVAMFQWAPIHGDSIIRIGVVAEFVGVLSLFIGMVAACATVALADQQPTDETKKWTYEDDVQPILREHCMSCHHQGDQRGGLALDTFASLMEGGGSGEIVYDDGDVDGSRLWQLVNHDDTPVMPPSAPKLSDSKLAVIRAWIEGGILENSGSKAKAKPKTALAYVASTTGRPEGAPPMPESLPQRVPVVSERASATTAVACSPWSPLAAIAGQRQISIYHTDTHELLGVLPFEEGIAQSLRFSRDGQYLIAGGGEHSVRGIAAVYDIRTGDRVATLGDELDTVFDADASGDMSRVALGGPKKMLRIFDATDGTLLFDIKKHTDWIYGVAFSPDGVLVASSDRSGGLCVWEADTGRLFLDLTGHKGAVNSVAWRDDSNVLASASDDGTVKLWDMVSGKNLKTIKAHGSGVTAVRFDHQGQIATAGKDKRVRIWDQAGKQVFQSQPSQEAVLEVAISHDSSRIVHGDWTGKVVSLMVKDIKQSGELAANPPPARQRLESVEKVLVSIENQLAPLTKLRDEAAAKLDASQERLDGIAQQRRQFEGSIAALTKDIETHRDDEQQATRRIQDLVASSRHQHDRVIAARLNSEETADDESLQRIAKLESALAQELIELSKARSNVVASRSSAEKCRKQLERTRADQTTLGGTVAAAEKAVKTAKAALEQANASRDVVVAQMNAKQQRKQQLLDAIQ
ncbi:MAG: c-type cytochrome domain-containing protein [Planctomycetota bacterium]